MAGLYVDTSALGRFLLGEPEADAILATFAAYEERWSSSLLSVELGRLAKLHDLTPKAAQLLARINLWPITDARLKAAAEIDPVQVRSLDTIHLDAAVELHAPGRIHAVLTYDHQLQAGCQHHGIDVLSPPPEKTDAREHHANTDPESSPPEPPTGGPDSP